MAKRPHDAQYVAQTIRAFLDGSGGAWDWDDFTSCSLADDRLDSIRRQALRVELPLGSDGRTALVSLAEHAERIITD